MARSSCDYFHIQSHLAVEMFTNTEVVHRLLVSA